MKYKKPDLVDLTGMDAFGQDCIPGSGADPLCSDVGNGATGRCDDGNGAFNSCDDGSMGAEP